MKTQFLLCFTIILLSATIIQGDEEKAIEKPSASVEKKEGNSNVGNHTAKIENQPKEEHPKAPVPGPQSSSEKHDTHDKATTSSPTIPVSPGEGTGVKDSMFNATKRAVYLLTGACILVLLYFLWKSYSLKRRQTHIHKYGVVASREDLEMTSLGFGSDDEEDDTTHFDIGRHQRS